MASNAASAQRAKPLLQASHSPPMMYKASITNAACLRGLTRDWCL
jgi:hypothetical protein